MKKILTEDLSWGDFEDPVTVSIEKKYLSANGEGESLATQAVTATVKLIYKWFNDGDVYDNTYSLEGWANDLSSYANWLYEYIPETEDILSRIKKIGSKAEYTQLLYDLLHTVLNWDLVNRLAKEPKVGTIYDCGGPFEFKEEIEQDDEWDDEEDDWGYDDEADDDF